ncbi:MAG: response regulator [Thermotogae bacterium]|nr:response regulator [Thermotogota bacterium]
MKKILVVDDETNIRNLIKKILSDEFEVDTAANGLEALKLLKNKEFDLMILDINMPQMDGVELMKKLKKHNVSIPIVVISVFSDPEKLIETFKLGATDFIVKPFSPDQILDTVNRIINYSQKKEEDTTDMIKETKRLISAGEIVKSREKVLELFKFLPSSPIPHFLYGLILEKEGKLKEAKKHFQVSLILDPSYDPAKKKLKGIGG